VARPRLPKAGVVWAVLAAGLFYFFTRIVNMHQTINITRSNREFGHPLFGYLLVHRNIYYTSKSAEQRNSNS